MISHINGKLLEKNPAYSIIECGGIGYHIKISLNTFSKIPDQENCKLLTHLSIKEDSHTLYGFYEDAERKLFRHLISVSGVGPNTAIMMLSSLSPTEIVNAILTDNVALIKSIKGIGPKSAQRLILELKDKLIKEDHEITASVQIQHTSAKTEALSALETLGFARSSSEKVIDEIIKSNDEELAVEELIKTSLKRL
ncbi:MAG: Holliday junction branch migration protein RuvA [Bacteroidetes bacterium]|nr:Holliday junction branch migration protein RuvA [Bacteroidia bacterium]PCH68267.1 MAG: Holliday junction branch migration protein RuvA [Bacteroidota bacterium]